MHKWILMLRFSFISMLALMAIGCSGQSSTNPVNKSSDVRITGESEPGKPFTIEIIVLDIDTREPIADAEIFVYHTNSKGDYERDARLMARIHGTAFTNAKGWIRFHTIFPRGYNDSPTGEHMHFHAKANGYKSENVDLGLEDSRTIPDNPQTVRAYLKSLGESDGKMKGEAVIFMKKR